MEVYREPHDVVNLPQEGVSYDALRQMRGSVQFTGVLLQQSWDRFCGIADQLQQAFREAETRAARGEPLLQPPKHLSYPVDGGPHREAVLLP